MTTTTSFFKVNNETIQDRGSTDLLGLICDSYTVSCLEFSFRPSFFSTRGSISRENGRPGVENEAHQTSTEVSNTNHIVENTKKFIVVSLEISLPLHELNHNKIFVYGQLKWHTGSK